MHACFPGSSTLMAQGFVALQMRTVDGYPSIARREQGPGFVQICLAKIVLQQTQL